MCYQVAMTSIRELFTWYLFFISIASFLWWYSFEGSQGVTSSNASLECVTKRVVKTEMNGLIHNLYRTCPSEIQGIQHRSHQ